MPDMQDHIKVTDVPKAKGRWSKKRLDDRELRFISAYFGSDSPTKHNGAQSAMAAGYSNKSAHVTAVQILKKYDDAGFGKALNAVGINKLFLAGKLRELFDNPSTKEQGILTALRLILSNMGERVDSQQAATTINMNSPKSLVLVGIEPKRLEAMTSPQTVLAEPSDSKEPIEVEIMENEGGVTEG